MAENRSEKVEIPIEGLDEANTVGGEEQEETIWEKASGEEEAAQEPVENQLEQLQRLQAEFLNYKRRVEKEKDEIGRYAKGNLILSILPVVDDFDRMIEHHANDETVTIESVRLIQQKLSKILLDEGLEPIECVGEEFDPECHEALGVQEVEEEQDHKVLEEWQKGYIYKDRLIRPSRVKVGKHTLK